MRKKNFISISIILTLIIFSTFIFAQVFTLSEQTNSFQFDPCLTDYSVQQQLTQEQFVLNGQTDSFLGQELLNISTEQLTIEQVSIINFERIFNLPCVFQLLGTDPNSYIQDSTAEIHPSSTINIFSLIFNSDVKETSIGVGTIVGENVELKRSLIGDFDLIDSGSGLINSSLGNFVSIGSNTELNGVTIGDLVSVGGNTQIGKNTKIGDNVIIGSDVEIGKDVVIGDNVTIVNKIKIKKGSNIVSNSIIGKIFLAQKVSCRENPFEKKEFAKSPYGTCEELLANKASVTDLVNSWKDNATDCRDQVDSIYDQAQAAVNDLRDQIIKIGGTEEDSVCVLLEASSSATTSPLISIGDGDSLVNFLETCRKQTKSVCDRTEGMWDYYLKICNKINDGKICGSALLIDNGYLKYIMPQVALARNHVKNVLFPNFINTCNNFLEALDSVKCGSEDERFSDTFTFTIHSSTPLTIVDLTNSSLMIVKQSVK